MIGRTFVPGEVVCRHADGRLTVEQVPHGRERAACSALRLQAGVRWVEPNLLYRTFSEIIPNDPCFANPCPTAFFGDIRQFWLRDLNAPAAWAAGPRRTLAAPRLAVIDTGIDAGHPDLHAKLARGLFGRVIGADTAARSDDFSDLNGHGTHVAGIAVAATDNRLDVAGVSFNAVQVMPVRAGTAAGTFTLRALVEAIEFATRQGAAAALMALGTTEFSQILQEAIDAAWEYGMVLVAAAGNSGLRQRFYPAANNRVLGAGALDRDLRLARFSTTGRGVGVVAPGVAILSTLPTYPVTLNEGGLFQRRDALSGTSMAAAVVAGLAAFLRAAAPSLTPAEVVRRIQQTAVRERPFWNPRTGYGRVDAGAAVLGQLRPAEAGSLVGQVVDEAGNPVRGIGVRAARGRAITGRDGIFRLVGLPPGEHVVRAGRAEEAATVFPGADTFVRLQLPPTPRAAPAGAARPARPR